jgi:RNA polymerase sigma-70 factor (ECF subfamily)
MSQSTSSATGEARSEEPDWREYIRRVAAGDREALSELYDQTSPLVYGLALRILRNRADAEEITLDVFTQVWRSAGAYDGRRGSVTAWLATLTRSRAIDRLRARANWDWQSDFEQAERSRAQPPAREAGWLAQQRLLVESALAELPGEQRRLIELAYFAGFSHTELASRTGLPLGTVKTRIRLAMMKLRELLAPAIDGCTERP